MYRWNQIFISCHKAFFICFGVFGNVNLIIIILSTEKLRSKSSYLQCIQSAAQLICLFNSFIDIYLLITDTRIPKTTCLYLTFPIVFCFCLQSTMIFFIILDILLSVIFPIKIRNLSTWKYLVAMTVFPCIWGISIVVWALNDLEDRMLILCNPPSAVSRNVRRVLFPVTVIVNTFALILFIILIAIFWKKKEHEKSHTAKIMRHLKVSAAMFIFSTYSSVFATAFAVMLGITGDDFMNIIGNTSMFAMLSYSHTFYTIMWRSVDYRRRFISLYSKTTASDKVTIFVPSHVKLHADSH